MKKNKLTLLALAIIATLSLSLGISVFAAPAPEQAMQEYFQANDELKTDQNINHSTFSAGNNVENNGQVNGILFSAGNNLRTNGSAEYAFLAGNNIDINANIEKDLFVAGNIININAPVNRDLYAFGSTVNLNSNVAQNAFVAGSKIQIADNVIINGNLSIDAESIALGENVKVTGLLSYNKEAVTKNLNSANYGSVSTYENPKIEKETPSPQSKLLLAIFKFISALIIFCLAILLLPKLPRKFAEVTNSGNAIAKQLGIGACALILVPVAAFFLIFTIVGMPLALILLAIYFIALYLSSYISGIYLGHIVITKVFNQKPNAYGSILLGIALIIMLTLVPVIGGAIKLLAICLGLGIIIDLIFVRKTKKAPSKEEIEEKSKTIQLATKDKLKEKESAKKKK